MPREQAKKWKKGEEETGRKGWSGGRQRQRGVKATWGYKYENTEKEGLL